jgi:hypothetical protein
MTIQTVESVCARIKHATKQKPISVFVVEIAGERMLDAVFGNTVEAKRRQVKLKPYHSSDKCKLCGHVKTELAEEWLGDFTWEMPAKQVREFLLKALQEK